MDRTLTQEREQIEKVIFSRKEIKQQLLCEVSVTTILYHVLFVFFICMFYCPLRYLLFDFNHLFFDHYFSCIVSH